MADKKKTRTKDRHGPHRMLRVPESLYLELEEVAQANDRPITWEGLRALRKHVKAEKARIKAGEPDQPGDA